MNKRERMMDRIKRHGENLLKIFPAATERDPVKLCKKLRRLEGVAYRVGLQLCNGPQFENENKPDEICEDVLRKVNKLLGNGGNAVPIFINRDPRGHAPKIHDSFFRGKDNLWGFHKDWGGDGIIAPDLSED